MDAGAEDVEETAAGLLPFCLKAADCSCTFSSPLPLPASCSRPSTAPLQAVGRAVGAPSSAVAAMGGR